MNSLVEISNILKNKNFFYILTHMYPDGDALGSAFALCRILQKLGKFAKVMYSNPIPEKFEYLTKLVTHQDFEPEYIISVDLADTGLLEPDLKKYSDKIDLCIDHHISNKNYSKIKFVDSKAAANCEIIYHLLKEMDVTPDSETASALYTGIATDTGCFEYSNTTADSHFIVSKLIELGAESNKINEKLFILKSKKKLSVEKLLYENLEYFFEGKCAITHITLSEMDKLKVNDNEIDGIASLPIKIEGVQIGITLREKTDNCYKVSVRTSSDINANDFCAYFGGGGHAKAGGFSISGNLFDIKNQISNKIKSVMEW